MIWFLALQLAISPQQYYESAKHDLSLMNLTQAEHEVDSALHLNPSFVPALILKARLAIFAHRPDVSKSCLITAVTVDPSSEQAQFFLGVFYYLQNDFKLAIPPLKIARSLSPKDPMPVFYLAMSQEALGNAPDALLLYQLAEDLPQGKPQQTAAVMVAHGRLLYSIGKYKESIERVQRAVETDEQSRDAHYELAKALNHEGNYKTAALEGERSLTLPDLGTSDGQVHFLLGNIYLKLEQFELAQAHLAKFRAAPQTTKR